MSGSHKDDPVKFDFDFDEAMERVAQTDPNEVTDLVQASVPESTIESLIDKFEEAGHDNGRGDKCWYARDLMVPSGLRQMGTVRRGHKSVHCCV